VTKTVWSADMMCCGEPFAVGSTVTWTLYSLGDGERRFFTAVLGKEMSDRLTDIEERHDFSGSTDAPPTELAEGVVRSIEAVSWQAHPLADDSPVTDALALYALPGSTVIAAQSSASRDDKVGGRRCMGYVVDLDVAVPGRRA
jgi:hypothetical protein